MKPPAAWPFEGSPFHAGELAIQERLGRRQELDRGVRSFMRASMVEQHRAFFARIPFVLVGSVDGTGQPWASILAAPPGFATSPDPKTLRVGVRPAPGDPLEENLRPGARVGVLGIHLPTRRRIRLNGRVGTSDAGGFTVIAEQSYGNCPQYIQAYDLHFLDARSAVERPPLRDVRLSPRDRELLGRADSFYIASANLDPSAGVAGGVDVSHRGGRPGFVGVEDERTVVTPDFVGNYFFNTLGNLAVEPRAGLLVPDYASGDVLLLAARSEIIWQGPDVDAFAGAERLLRFHITAAIRLPEVLPFRAGAPEYARELPRTGTWEEARRARAAGAAESAWRTLRVASTTAESDTIRSFVLEPADGDGLAAYRAGQFLPLRVPAGGDGAHLVRPYSLSDAPNGRSYRISVKRDGLVSTWLHEHMGVGALLDVLPPRGSFVFDENGRRPALLLSAGVGITPMIAFLNTLLVNDGRSRFAETLTFVHVARNGREQAFARELRDKIDLNDNLAVHIAYTAPTADDALGKTHDSVGRIDADRLEELLPTPDLDAYVCGPPGFMQDMYTALRGLGVADRHIRFEVFAGKAPRRDATVALPSSFANDESAPEIVFARTGKRQRFLPAFESLLECAEAAGVAIPYSCRSGVCGTCATRLVSGTVVYANEPAIDVPEGEILVCSARPSPPGQDAVSGAIVLDA